MNRKLIEKTDTLLSKEKGTIFKDPGGKINICIVYPNTYYIGMSNLGFQGIYNLLNNKPDVVCERSFLPDDHDSEEHMRTLAPLFSVESKRPLTSFDIVAFSISFENDYPNILRILDATRIPFRAKHRERFYPLIIAGGVCCFSNPEPFADVFDIIFVGEAEESLNEFLDAYRTHISGKRGGKQEKEGSKETLKRSVMNNMGIYVPEFYHIFYHNDGTIAGRIPIDNAPETIVRRWVRDLSISDVTTAIITPETAFPGMYLVEVMRGCPWRCRFCLVGALYKPVRSKRIEEIRGEIARAQQFTQRIGLVGPSLSDYPAVNDLLYTKGVEFSITSLRSNEKSAELIRLLTGNKSVSIAPEAGTERMRTVINKQVTEEDILNTSAWILDAGIKNLRLYFMIGLPTERLDDIEGIIELVMKVRGRSRQGIITLSISTFVPKPFTAFQWHPMEQAEDLKKKLKLIKDGLKNKKGVRVLHDVPKYALLQGLFARGDRTILRLVEAMVRTNDWMKASNEVGLDRDFSLMRQRSYEEKLPWDFIDAGISKQRLWDEYISALSQI